MFFVDVEVVKCVAVVDVTNVVVVVVVVVVVGVTSSHIVIICDIFFSASGEELTHYI